MSDRAAAGFFDGFVDRTLTRLRGAWREIAGSARGVLTSGLRPDLPDDDANRLRQQMLSCLDGRGGEVTARARAAALGRTYLALNDAGRERFLRLLAEEFDTDRATVDRCCATLAAAMLPAERSAAERALRSALIPPRVNLLRQFNALPEGVKFLVDMRAELIGFSNGDSTLRALADDLRELLANWFDIGFLELKRITWDSPAALLEKLMVYESVHEIRGWTDLKNRLEADRRCFAFFHPRMPDEPLIFVEVALVKGMSGNIQALLDEEAPLGDAQAADAAIFYSISNCQRGLVGISFGDFLIKRVVDALARELPRLKIFATLSPMPGFRTWLAAEAEHGGLLLPAEVRSLQTIAGAENGERLPERQLLDLVDSPGWFEDARTVAVLREPLLRLGAQYLVQARAPSGRALDPVAHFHLTNGARVDRLNWLADRSSHGLRQSAGMMVNYLYRLDEIEANNASYQDGSRPAAAAVRGLLKNGEGRAGRTAASA
jgi:malonyl-CoA decarboxylase